VAARKPVAAEAVAEAEGAAVVVVVAVVEAARDKEIFDRGNNHEIKI
jgi:hypothetical protein